jgi:hypothetical protein
VAPYRKPGRPGLTLIQLLVVLALLLLLGAILVPAVSRVRDAAARMQSMNNLKQLALAVHNAHDVFNGMPPVVGEWQNKTGSLHFFVLPFLEQDNLYKNAATGSWDNETWGQRLPLFLDPRDPSPPPGNVYKGWLATTNYPANWMVFKDGNGGTTFAQIPDGTSNTLMYAQRYQVCGGDPTAWGYPSLFKWAPMVAYGTAALPQLAPRQDECDPTRPQAISSAMLAAVCDGSCRALNPQISAQTWANFCDPADGNVLGNDF